MQVLGILQDLDLGNSVAEFDTALEKYFVETHIFRQLIRDEADIVAGDKGTGKTALFRILNDRYTAINELSDIEVVPAFNPTGNPVFQRLAEGNPLQEGQYTNVWKAYVLALVGNWVLEFTGEEQTELRRQLHNMLHRLDLQSDDDSPATIFSRVVNLFRRLLNPKSIEAAVTIAPHGMPILVPKIEFGEPDESGPPQTVPFEEAFTLLDRVLSELGIGIWLVFDRLDEAFQGFPAAEIPALRALFRTYLDLIPYDRIRLKLFVRKDLFRRIIGTSFVNLTHVNARKVEITWEEDDLWDLLRRRLAESPQLLSRLAIANSEDASSIWEALVPDQVDPGSRKPKTWTWIMRRIRDGNDVRPPRNLIDLLKKAQAVHIRKEEREHNEYPPGPLLTSDSLKRGLSMLSDERVQDTLIAEAGDEVARYIEQFKGGKAEHNLSTLSQVLGLEGDDLARAIQALADLGFIEKLGMSYTVPALYRDGLNITQGKAFATGDAASEDEEDN